MQTIKGSMIIAQFGFSLRTFFTLVAGVSLALLGSGCNNQPEQPPYAVYTITSPRQGEIYRVGDTIHIKWDCDLKMVYNAVLSISPDSGRRWEFISDAESVLEPTWPTWRNYPWVAVDSVAGMQLAGKQCRIKVADYDRQYPAFSGYFTIMARP